MGSESKEENLVFVVEWMEPFAPLPRKFLFTFFCADNTVSLFDIVKRRYFLSRTPCNTVTKPNIHIGNTINVLSRQLKIIGYGDTNTKKLLEDVVERSYAILKPRVFNKLGLFLEKLNDLKIEVRNLKMIRFDSDLINYLLRWSPNSKELSKNLDESVVLVIELYGVNASGWSLVDYGIDDFCSNVYSPSDQKSAKQELRILFSPNKPFHCNTATFASSCSCCIIKPHAVIEGHSGKIIQRITNEGFTITALEMFFLTINEANEFFEVYKGIIPKYQDMLEEMCSGPCIVMEIQSPNPANTIPQLRELVGPLDPYMAKTFRPNSLRATFGIDKTRNAVHCTDLPEDGELEIQYFFKFLGLQ